MENNKTLIFGAGWLGREFSHCLNAHVSTADITDSAAVRQELLHYHPETVLNAAGKKGHPNIDWCENHKTETVSSNITGPLILMRECLDRNIHFTHLSSGCIFDGPSPQPEGFSEEDTPNPVSFYAWTKATADEILQRFPVLIIRLRIPMDRIPGPGNTITKLAGYQKIIDAENSISVVSDLISATVQLIEKRRTGIYNVTNPGTICYRDLMKWYTEIVDSTHPYELIPQSQLQSLGLVKTGRSNCILDTRKLQSEGIYLPPAVDAVKACLQEYKNHLEKT